MIQDTEAVLHLQRALELDEDQPNALVNLGSFYNDDGMVGLARKCFLRAAELEQSSVLELRPRLLFCPVSESWEHMVRQVARMYKALRSWCDRSKAGAADSKFDRVHFYIVYTGLQERSLQKTVNQAYLQSIDLLGMNPELTPSDETLLSQRRASSDTRIRIGFISKFFGIYEPHGLLLDGVIEALPHDKVYVVVLPVSR
jgi:tetratricopeptide (TPR) repeat protein